MASSRRVSFGLCLVGVITLSLLSAWSTMVDAQRVATSTTERARETQRVTVDVDNAPLGTVLSLIARQAGLLPFFDSKIVPSTARVTLHVHEIAASVAFDHALRGTGLVATVLPEGNVIIVRNPNAITALGVITGRVIADATKQPLRGAKVGLDNTDRVTETADDGSYRLANITAGSHTVIIRLLGYARAARTVQVRENETTTIDMALDVSATPLDQIVVTGTVVQTELKAVPNAITVITAKQIEERGITKIDQLFRGDVPGLFAQNRGSGAPLDEVTMFSRGATALPPSSMDLAITNPIKTYVDGVELADPKYLSQIDPKSIERIEILTGPQASTIYGSNAINGVMQIFTKRGTSSTPQLTLNLLSGWVENNFSSARTPQHDYSTQLSGIEGRLAYNAGGSWNYIGSWTPAKQTARTGGFGGARLELPTSIGRITADVTLRRSVTQNRQRGSQNQTLVDYIETGWYVRNSSVGLSQPITFTLDGQTLGVTLSYVPTSWWSHELGFGTDASNTEQRVTARGYLSIADTTLQLAQGNTDRRSLRYTTTVHIPVASVVQGTVTVGADAWQSVTSSMSISPQTLTGPLTGSTSLTRQPMHNTGSFLQTQLGLNEQLFLTYGLRAEWNPGFGREVTPNYAPRYGIAYTQDMETPFGAVTAKVRGSYGRSTRPPQPGLKAAQAASDPSIGLSFLVPYYNQFDFYLANPTLNPEHQQGAEGGLELYLGTRGSLVITRYNQTVDALIANVKADSVRSLTTNPLYAITRDVDGYGYWYQYQYLNVGSIRNQGWELQGSVNVGPLTTRGTYSWTKSRSLGINPKYRRQFSPPASYPQYQPGGTFVYSPEHTWALGVTYARSATTLGLNVTGSGRVAIFNDDMFFRNFHPNIRLPQNKLNVSSQGYYVNVNRGYALANVAVSHRFLSQLEGLLQIQNLADHYTNDYSAANAVMGRQVKAGIRINR